MKIKLVNEDIRTNYGINLLRARGVEDVEKFIKPTEDALQDWRDLKDIKEGINLIFALPGKAHIGIVVD